MPLSDQDLIAIISLLLIAVIVVLFPPGGGTPRRIPIPWRPPAQPEPVFHTGLRVWGSDEGR